GEILRQAEVIRDDLEITVSASGNVVANEKVNLTFGAPAEVEAINVEVGDYVEEGKTLAQLDTTDLQRAVVQAEVSLEQAELRKEQLEKPVDEEEIRRAQNRVNQAANSLEIARLNYTKVLSSSVLNEDLETARARFNDAQTQYGMRQMGYEEGTVSDWTRDRARDAADDAYWQLVRLEQQGELEKERAQNDMAQAWDAYQEARDQLEILEEGADPIDLRSRELDIRTAELSLERAQEDLEAAQLTAPFDGVVADLNLQEGVQPPTTAPAVTLIDDSVFFVDVTVDETDIGRVEIGQTVEIIVDAYPNISLTGEVETIAPAPSSVNGVVAYPVRVRLEPHDEVEVRDGMTASVLIRTSRLPDVLLVPNWAVRTDQSSQETYTYCYCVREGTPQRTPIEIGARNEMYTQILSGLEEGETVALVTEERNLLEMTGPPSRGD
ncbi:MAG: HlyD family secretion protein, partial [Anaerolineae bacterium]